MTIALGSDHGGFALKEHLKTVLTQKGISVQDCGCHSAESVDYPVYGRLTAEAVASGACTYGIVVCTTGIGISIAANKIHGIRCALCGDPLSAELARRHNNANMLALGGGMIGPKLAERILEAFLSASFEGGRHQRRVDLISALEKS